MNIAEILKCVTLVVASSAIAFVLFVAAYEGFEYLKYKAWTAEFDNYGWFGKITVPSSNPNLMWEYRPYGKYGTITINRYGFRGHDYESQTKPDDKYRIAFVGDSVTLGLGVNDDETFVARIGVLEQTMLPNKSVQALNFGIDGYNTAQIYEMIVSKVIRFSPDEIIYAICLNDFDFWDASGGKIRYFRKPTSFFFEMLERYNVGSDDYHQYYFKKNQQTVYEYTRRMKEFADRNGVMFRVMIIPVFSSYAEGFDNYKWENIHSSIAEYLAGNNIEVLDLLPVFLAEGSAPRDLSAKSIWHPNAAGHDLIANEVLRSYQ